MQQSEQKYKVIKIIGKRRYMDHLEYLVQFEFKNQCAWMKLEYLKNHLSFVNDYEFAIMSKEVDIQKTLEDFQIDLNLDPNQMIQVDDIESKDEQKKQDKIKPQKQGSQKKQNQKQQTNSKKQIIQSQEQQQQQEQLKLQLLEKEKDYLEQDQQKKLKEQQLGRKPDLEDQDQNVLEVRKIKRYYG